MYRFVTVLLVAGVAFASSADAEQITHQTEANASLEFNWPDINSDIIPDARVKGAVRGARENYQRAINAAERANASAGKLPGYIEEGEPFREIVSEGVILEGVLFDKGVPPQQKLFAGEIEYETGSTARGLVAFLYYPDMSNWGEVVADFAPEKPYSQFEGDMKRPSEAGAYPMEGVLTYRNGDTFTGLFYTWGGASGIYEAANGKRSFSGDFDTVGLMMHPKKGVVEDQNGQLLSVVLD
ncbi:hypothetical protein [Henriciella sp.]|uniref:hypothetical protein n=1 Tax=Henriciella sp. TaxID=1968823 RepID=UPI002630BF54|nr:hypothetical protein [Henriciella sp.]